jgi:hypothetical protein
LHPIGYGAGVSHRSNLPNEKQGVLQGPNLARAELLDANLALLGWWRIGVVAIKTKSLERGLTKRGDWPMRKAGNGEGRSASKFTTLGRARYQTVIVFRHYRKSYGI